MSGHCQSQCCFSILEADAKGRWSDALAAAGLVTSEEVDALEPVLARFSAAVTPEMARAINPDDPDDPLARQPRLE